MGCGKIPNHDAPGRAVPTRPPAKGKAAPLPAEAATGKEAVEGTKRTEPKTGVMRKKQESAGDL